MTYKFWLITCEITKLVINKQEQQSHLSGGGGIKLSSLHQALLNEVNDDWDWFNSETGHK